MTQAREWLDKRDLARVGYDDTVLRGRAPSSDGVLHFWDTHETDIGSIRHRTGLWIDELTDDELCLHMAEARRMQTPESFEEGERRSRMV